MIYGMQKVQGKGQKEMKSGYMITKTNRMDVENMLKENGGYCPCQVGRTSETKCICKDFKDKIEDETFSGLCMCGLYKLERRGK